MSENEGDVQVDRAAPTRKRYGSNSSKNENLYSSNLTETNTRPDDEAADDMIAEVTGKRFSITKLFQRKSSKKRSSSDSTSEQNGEEAHPVATEASKSRGNSLSASADANKDSVEALFAPAEDIKNSVEGPTALAEASILFS